MAGNTITERELNRALLARQGLLERRNEPLARAVEAVGALQMQYWPALPPALWSRVAGCAPDAPYRAHETGELLTGTLLRGTIHTVSAVEYPEYAAVTAASKALRWRTAKDGPEPDLTPVLAELAEYVTQPRTAAEIVQFLEDWVARHPGALDETETAFQRTHKWRPLYSKLFLVRAPADGAWGPKTPSRYRLAPVDAPPPVEEALPVVVRRHLRAFGPAAAEDVAAWISWNITPVRAVLERMEDLAVFTDDAGRTLYDLPDAPRPDAATPAPVRLLPWFDSALLAYAPRHRARLLPDAHKDDVFSTVNGQIKATFLVDGMVAGRWSATTARGVTTLTLTPFVPLAPATRKALIAEAELMAAHCHPASRSHAVEIAD